MDSIFEYLLNNHDKLLYGIAGICLLVELTVIGLSGPLLFIAIGSALTGALVSLGLISSWEMELLFVGLFSFLSALLLWKPLKHFQGTKAVADNSSDMIGQTVPVSETVTVNGGKIRFSGINWNARLSEDASVESIAADTRAVITGMDGNIAVIDQLPAK
ncbi:NfeD family protein [Psychromonas ossibalaenae]|uniref:NfeD family protein n=1 Tax=Psychromonas ossibalaenae TaxID=444922 RepID=UPI000382A730|nr:NfeD family protein [Psychromonas ossibalaenae]